MTTRARAPVVGAALVAAALAANAVASRTAAPCARGQVARTASYVLALTLGPAETMYTSAQVKAKHPKSGEVMLGGRMSPMHMGMGHSFHLELHVCSRASGAVVTGAKPAISITDAKGMTSRVPVAEMEGIGEGRADYHYGNNVALIPGSRISVTVVLRGERAVFHLAVPTKTRAMKG